MSQAFLKTGLGAIVSADHRTLGRCSFSLLALGLYNRTRLLAQLFKALPFSGRKLALAGTYSSLVSSQGPVEMAFLGKSD